MAQLWRMRPLPPLALAALLSAPARGQELPRLTTASAGYCEELSLRLAAMVAQGGNQAGEGPRRLAEDGRRLCQDGHVRAGIAKLRRAMRAVQEARVGE